MSDSIPSPTVLTLIRSGRFTVRIYAYRLLTQRESMMVLSNYMRQKRIRSLPSHGSVSIYTQIGSDPSAGV